jgi:hypothetical protein
LTIAGYGVKGESMAKGLIPVEIKLAGCIVKAICYNNDRDYFGFE